MSTNWPSHGRLISRFNSLGPYLRKPLSSEKEYFFDCLSECANTRLEPEKREFYGWWLKLNVTEQGCFEYQYWYGFFDQQGNWSEQDIPEQYDESVKKTLLDFYAKLAQETQELEIELLPSPSLDISQVLAA
ncbi:sigma factor-binding protein Crl [Celerinatantimonas diazotrophica]|uniref:Sigma factor-binding protein Crl n=1 Tax=Celerinatantimonas diazotrophica TaxID=412034 RepID=A0A4R1K3J6_9GAMM|nr:sigma factor-binding protein Crl [Celerinatantimonas diazotrophica]TCK58656.1 sigma factor-binding protein Crl [Celerinatantimonas diazotrophica]CAG9297285.1 Sigma factor-binding protein Crl [Celerinatantimonas diazotrophica]